MALTEMCHLIEWFHVHFLISPTQNCITIHTVAHKAICIRLICADGVGIVGDESLKKKHKWKNRILCLINLIKAVSY